MRIRRATPADAEALWRIRARAIAGIGAPHCTAAQRAAWTARRTPAAYAHVATAQRIVVAEADDGRIAGFAQLDPAEGIVEACYVDPECAGRGVGRALMCAVEQEAARLRHSRLALEATPNAVGFYARLGYAAQGELAQALGGGQSLACTLMAKPLAAPAPPRGHRKTRP